MEKRVTPTNKAARAYTKEFGAAMLAYFVVLPISIVLVEASHGAAWRIPIALTPVVPAVFALRAVVHFLGHIDELQRHIQLEALAFAFGATALLTFSYGFLEGVGFPHLDWTFVLPLMCALWGLSTAVRSRGYS